MKKITAVFIILAVIVGTVFAWRVAYSMRKSNDNLPALSSVAEMSESEVNSILPGYKIKQLKEVWGEPWFSEGNTAQWQTGNLTLIVNFKNNGVVAICGLKDAGGESVETDIWAIAAHVYLDGNGFFHNGKLSYELPEGYEYAGDVINVGNTFSGKDFEGNVDGKIYLDESVTDTVYFSWAEWDEEKDGPPPFLKLEFDEKN